MGQQYWPTRWLPSLGPSDRSPQVPPLKDFPCALMAAVTPSIFPMLSVLKNVSIDKPSINLEREGTVQIAWALGPSDRSPQVPPLKDFPCALMAAVPSVLLLWPTVRTVLKNVSIDKPSINLEREGTVQIAWASRALAHNVRSGICQRCGWSIGQRAGCHL
jgi:hypothetical protein